jgi:probable sporulation protein (polysaccharide deacetylase family)
VKNTKSLIAVALIAILTIVMVQNPIINTYVSILKGHAVYTAAVHTELYQKIEEEASHYNIPPKDAVIDPVWKATPGYNGIQVDVNASFKKMKKSNRFDPHKLVFKQISPKVHLDDLEASPIYRGYPEKPMVSFLINVAWGNEYLPKILSTLKKYNVHATFFLEGRWVKENPELAKMIVDGGNEVGNHSYTHPDMKTLASEQVREQLIKTNQVIEATTGKKVKWFAPPSGSYRDEVIKIANSLDLSTIMWTVDTIDWQKPTQDVLVQRVLKKVGPGAMILMHPTKPTADGLETLIKEIKKRQLRIGTVSRLLDEERIVKVDGGPSSNRNNDEIN